MCLSRKQVGIGGEVMWWVNRKLEDTFWKEVDTEGGTGIPKIQL